MCERRVWTIFPIKSWRPGRQLTSGTQQAKQGSKGEKENRTNRFVPILALGKRPANGVENNSVNTSGHFFWPKGIKLTYPVFLVLQIVLRPRKQPIKIYHGYPGPVAKKKKKNNSRWRDKEGFWIQLCFPIFLFLFIHLFINKYVFQYIMHFKSGSKLFVFERKFLSNSWYIYIFNIFMGHV